MCNAELELCKIFQRMVPLGAQLVVCSHVDLRRRVDMVVRTNKILPGQ